MNRNLCLYADKPNGPTRADVTRSLCDLASTTLDLAGELIEALEAGRDHFPPEARPIVDRLSQQFAAQKDSTAAAIEFLREAA